MSAPEDRPRARPGVEAVDVDGELVLWEPALNRVHRLDRTASLLWPLLDGTVTLAELAEDVADVFGIGPDQALTDVEALVDSLVAQGLLEDGDAAPTVAEGAVRYLVDPPDQ